LTRLLVVTPAFGRFELTRACLAQRVRTIEGLAKLGVEAECVVVADDENLDTARALGFSTIESPNVLSARFNDGHEHAVARGFDWSLALGSDQVIDPAVLAVLPVIPPETVLATRWLTAVRADGAACLQFRHPIYLMKVYPRALLARCPRPHARVRHLDA
jgi:hypothetical protein